MPSGVTQDHALEAEWAAEHVLGQPLASCEVVGAEPQREVHVEARVAPRTHLPDDGLVDLAALQEKLEDLALPELLEGLGLELRHTNQRAVVGREEKTVTN